LRAGNGKAGEHLFGSIAEAVATAVEYPRMSPVRAMSPRQRRRLWLALAAYAGFTLALLTALICL